MKLEVKLLEMMARKNIRRIAELHELTGISRTTIQLILDGKKNALYFDTIATLCQKLDCKIEELLVIVDEEAS
ncbi:helix-turn-helix transcriptional regulator [Peribacillus frigoritolerans]|uniref:helix-turn-helix domain-containing protein n=1 Tax=Peribacillus frigoritolerans TaxID=450367 RepID=UPI002EBAFE96|nr:helix-turn-helix transcriptional regulator [Peribacillus frigoritolerans]